MSVRGQYQRAATSSLETLSHASPEAAERCYGLLGELTRHRIEYDERTANKMIECEEFLRCVQDEERREMLRDSLTGSLQVIADLGRGKAKLYRDFAPLSFGFSAGSLQGGLIFHGEHDGGGDGGMPTLSVCLTPADGWRIHT
jgi:hypothetical protein